jgi:hypothetical protein
MSRKFKVFKEEIITEIGGPPGPPPLRYRPETALQGTPAA